MMSIPAVAVLPEGDVLLLADDEIHRLTSP
jgi:hypothetical protein